VTYAARVELRRVDVESSAVGQAVLALARRIDGGTAENGSALAALVKEFRASLAAACRVKVEPADPIEVLRGQVRGNVRQFPGGA
jgi:hypothetical protein